MTARPSPRLTAALLGFARLACIVAAVLGLLALVGWTFSIDALRSFPHTPRRHTAMNPMTAVGFLLCGIALWLSLPRAAATARRARRAAITLAIAAIVIGAMKLLAYRVPLPPIDRLLFPIRSAGNPMAPNTAAAFVLLGLALGLLDVKSRRGDRPAVPLALLTAGAAALALIGYLYGVESFYGLSGYIPMALNTAIGFLLLGTGVLAARPAEEPVATLLSGTAGGVVARRLLPAAAILPVLLGWLRLLGERRGYYDSPFGVSLFTLAIMAVFLTLIWLNARFLLRLDLQRRTAERKAEEEHHFLRTLIDNLPDNIFVKAPDNRFLLNNLAHAKRLGAARPEDLLGRSDADFFPPELAEQYHCDERRVIETGVPMVDKEQHIVDNAGHDRWVTVTKVPFRDTRGAVVGIVGISHDITLRKLLEQERDRFFTISLDLMAVSGFDGRFVHVNPAFETTLGYTAAEVMARPWIEFVHPDDREATMAEGRKLSLGVVTINFENRYLCKDGSYKWLSWTAVPDAKSQRIYCVARNTTERRRVLEELRTANLKLDAAARSEREAYEKLKAAQSTMVQTEKLAAMGQMVAGVAHEINNPLAFVGNNVAVLQRDLRGVLRVLELYRRADPVLEQHDGALMTEVRELAEQIDLAYSLENAQELLTRSRDGLKRIQQIVKDLRDFARLDESDLKEVDLNDGVRSTITIITGHAKKKGVRIETDLPPLPPVTCYPAKVNQVIMNLLSNAIDASPDNGVVTVRTRGDAQAGTAQIEVSDHGTGIPPHIRERIFDPFFTTKPPGQGTGLGLSISYGIVRDHGGSIAVQSELGQGTTFTVTLPLRAARAHRAEVLSNE